MSSVAVNILHVTARQPSLGRLKHVDDRFAKFNSKFMDINLKSHSRVTRSTAIPVQLKKILSFVFLCYDMRVSLSRRKKFKRYI